MLLLHLGIELILFLFIFMLIRLILLYLHLNELGSCVFGLFIVLVNHLQWVLVVWQELQNAMFIVVRLGLFLRHFVLCDCFVSSHFDRLIVPLIVTIVRRGVSGHILSIFSLGLSSLVLVVLLMYFDHGSKSLPRALVILAIDFIDLINFKQHDLELFLD